MTTNKIKHIELATKKELDIFIAMITAFAWTEAEEKLKIYPSSKFLLEFGWQLVKATKRIIEGKSLLEPTSKGEEEKED